MLLEIVSCSCVAWHVIVWRAMAFDCIEAPQYYSRTWLDGIIVAGSARHRLAVSRSGDASTARAMLYYAMIYHTMLCYTILHYNILYYTILYSTTLYCTILYCTVLYCTVLYCTVLYNTTAMRARLELPQRQLWTGAASSGPPCPGEPGKREAPSY